MRRARFAKILQRGHRAKMPARHDSARRPSRDDSQNVAGMLRDNLGGLALLDMARELFPEPFLCTLDGLESRNEHVVFSGGSGCYVLVPRVLVGKGYKDNAENIRKGFSDLGITTKGVVSNSRAAGFMYSLGLEEQTHGSC